MAREWKDDNRVSHGFAERFSVCSSSLQVRYLRSAMPEEKKSTKNREWPLDLRGQMKNATEQMMRNAKNVNSALISGENRSFLFAMIISMLQRSIG
jgi:hypothetical protein